MKNIAYGYFDIGGAGYTVGATKTITKNVVLAGKKKGKTITVKG